VIGDARDLTLWGDGKAKAEATRGAPMRSFIASFGVDVDEFWHRSLQCCARRIYSEVFSNTAL
jgi:hypothetical protein